MIHVLSCAFPALPPVCKYRFFDFIDSRSYFGKNGHAPLKSGVEFCSSAKEGGHRQNHCGFFSSVSRQSRHCRASSMAGSGREPSGCRCLLSGLQTLSHARRPHFAVRGGSKPKKD